MTLQETIEANPNGFTLDPKTGRMATHEAGYYVALTNGDGNQHELDKFVKAFSFFKRFAGRRVYIGGWKDGNRYYVDYVVWVMTGEEAETLGRMFNQKAIYACEAKKSINL